MNAVADVVSLMLFKLLILGRVSRFGDIEGDDGSEEVIDDDDVRDGEDDDGDDDGDE